MKLANTLLLCLVFSFFTLNSTLAQDQANKVQIIRGDIFYGLGPALSKENLAINLGAELQTNFGLLQFRLNKIREGLKVFPEEEPLESLRDVSFLYGWRLNLDESNEKSALKLSILLGLGEVSVTKRGAILSEGSNFGSKKFEKIENRGVGLSYEVSFSSRENRLGAKVAITGNINEIESYSGLIVGFILKIF